jgi:hypothetical protein
MDSPYDFIKQKLHATYSLLILEQKNAMIFYLMILILLFRF